MLKKIITTLFTKGFVAIINLVILSMASKQLGGDISGQVSILILNIAIIQVINEIYTGYALVYFIPKFMLQKIYFNGIIWTIACTSIISIVLGLLFVFFDIGIKGQWIHLVILSFLIILHSFHMVIILGKEKISAYNFLNFLQPFLLLSTLTIIIFIFNIKTVNSYFIALYVSFGIAICFSIKEITTIFKNEKKITQVVAPNQIIEIGFYNQLANLSHLLSNRYNFYLLSNATLVGVYHRSTTLIESVLIISGSVAPIILTKIANSEDSKYNAHITFLLAKICLALSTICVFVIYLIPRAVFVYFLGQDFIHVNTIMLYLAPGILCISFSTIISHYFAGLGKQKIIVVANVSGLIVTLCTSYFFVKRYQLLGACYSTGLSYFVASFILVVVFMKQHKFNVLSFFNFKKELEIFKKAK